MSLVSLPSPPIDFELGTFPRHYLVGDTSMSADQFNAKPIGSIAGIPVVCPEDIDQSTPFYQSMNILSVQLQNGIPYEKIELKPRSDESRQEFIENFKFSLMTDLIRNGVPRVHCQNEGMISYFFRGETFVFDIEDLCALDFFRFPMTPHELRGDVITPHAINMASQYLLIPCKKNNKPSIFQAQHKAAKDLLQKYFEAYRAYIGELNDLIKFLEDYKFDKQYNIHVLWENLYGTANFYGQTDRIVLK